MPGSVEMSWGGGLLFEHFILSLTGSEHGVMGYLPNELSLTAVSFPLHGRLKRVQRDGHAQRERGQFASI